MITSTGGAEVDIPGCRSELPGPGRTAVRAITPEERVGGQVSGVRLAGERSPSGAREVDPGPVDGDSAADIGVGRAELMAPKDVAVRVVFPEERVNAASVRPMFLRM